MIFDTFSKDDVLREENGVVKWKGNELPAETLATLKQEAQAFSKSLLWKILKAELQWYAMKSLITEGKEVEDIRVARAFGNIVNVVDEKLKSL